MPAILLLLLVSVDLDALAKNPGVAKVERVLPGGNLIIHVLDWHYVSKEELGRVEGLKGAELDAAHANVLAQAAAVHKSKLQILRDVPEVFQEGLTDRNQTVVAAEIKSLAPYHILLWRDGVDDPDHERGLLRLGAAGPALVVVAAALVPMAAVDQVPVVAVVEIRAAALAVAVPWRDVCVVQAGRAAWPVVR
ncbi:hypothetical protein [Anatilimnocola floriformis]|uniref:hypothetical protein n=1 Tax=Anatilimnocola floriformis TaxID=2948575 RepID=UPI0020C34260|nr:hypothetical protein [Anatilimnocola floriformis]